MNLDLDQDYLEFLKTNADKFHKSPVGFTNFEGHSESSQVSSRQNNTIIGLLIRILQKLDSIEQRIDHIEHNKLSEVAVLTNKIEQISVVPKKKATYNLVFIQAEQKSKETKKDLK